MANRRNVWLGVLAQLGVQREEFALITPFRNALASAYAAREDLQQVHPNRVQCWRALFNVNADEAQLTQMVFDETAPEADIHMGGPAAAAPPPPPADPLSDLAVKATRIVAEMEVCGGRALSAAQKGHQRVYDHHLTHLLKFKEAFQALDEDLLIRLDEAIVDPGRVIAFQTDVRGAKSRLVELQKSCIRAWDAATTAKLRELDELDKNCAKAEVISRLYTTALARVTGESSRHAPVWEEQRFNNFPYLMDD